MAIYDILCEVKDVREADTGICEFNGFLEDYLSIMEKRTTTLSFRSSLKRIII